MTASVLKAFVGSFLCLIQSYCPEIPVCVCVSERERERERERCVCVYVREREREWGGRGGDQEGTGSRNSF